MNKACKFDDTNDLIPCLQTKHENLDVLALLIALQFKTEKTRKQRRTLSLEWSLCFSTPGFLDHTHPFGCFYRNKCTPKCLFYPYSCSRATFILCRWKDFSLLMFFCISKSVKSFLCTASHSQVPCSCWFTIPSVTTAPTLRRSAVHKR